MRRLRLSWVLDQTSRAREMREGREQDGTADDARDRPQIAGG